MNSRVRLLFIGIILLAAFFRFFDLKSIPPGLYPDEAMNGNNAMEALSGGGWKVFYPDNNGREGLFINIQAFSLYIFGSEPWALRAVSAIFGTLTVVGIFFLSRVLFSDFRNRDLLSLLASFFLATSFWHINFSRIGFRAIMAPFFLIWGLYFFFRFYKDQGSNASQIISAVFGGLFFGLGFSSYIAYRAAPLILLFPLYLGWKESRHKIRNSCFPCLSFLFILFAFLSFLPLGIYFLENPMDFFGRTSQISIFSEESPLKALGINILKTLGMFWVYGDNNWRHNFSTSPELSFPVGIFFLIGIIFSIRKLFSSPEFISTFLLLWLTIILLPVVVSSEGLPHALRSIIAIPPTILLAALGFSLIVDKTKNWFYIQKSNFPAYSHQLSRIRKEVMLFTILLFIAMAVFTFNKYFNIWANRPEVYEAFSTRDWNLAKFLNKVPEDYEKYVVITGERIDQRIISISAQSVLFGTGTFLQEERIGKKFYYLTPRELEERFLSSPPQKAVIGFLKKENRELIVSLSKKYPGIKLTVPGDFIILEFIN